MSEADEERFNALYLATRAQITAYSLRRTTTGEEAADVVADTYEIAWRKLDDIPASPDDLLWLYVTARHVLANATRRIHRRDEVVARLAEGLRAVGLAVQPSDEAGVVALSCLMSLPADDRELLMLTAWDGLSSADAGRVLGCSPTATRIRLHRARARLRSEMTPAGAPRKRSAGVGQELEDRRASAQLVPEEVVEQ
jgi:RNA polymerase sigma-70 factor (ECF subfamily)